MLALIDKQKLLKSSPAGALFEFEYKSNRDASAYLGKVDHLTFSLTAMFPSNVAR